MALFPLIRLVALATVVLFSLVVLGISAHITYETNLAGFYFTFAAMSIAVASLSLATLPAMIIIDLLRKGAFTSMVVVELAWLGLLWVLWLTAAGLTASGNYFSPGCNYRAAATQQACREVSSIEAFGFLSWLVLFSYWIALLVMSIIGSSRGHKIFTSTVGEAQFTAPAVNPPVQQQPMGQYPQGQAVYPQGTGQQQYPQQYPQVMGQQQQYPAQQYPPQPQMGHPQMGPGYGTPQPVGTPQPQYAQV